MRYLWLFAEIFTISALTIEPRKLFKLKIDQKVSILNNIYFYLLFLFEEYNFIFFLIFISENYLRETLTFRCKELHMIMYKNKLFLIHF